MGHRTDNPVGTYTLTAPERQSAIYSQSAPPPVGAVLVSPFYPRPVRVLAIEPEGVSYEDATDTDLTGFAQWPLVAEFSPPPPAPRHSYVVAVYDAALAWGGPEEGGWWYNAGSLVRVVKVFGSENKARRYCRRLNARLESRTIGPNTGKRDKSSVLSDGVFEAHLFEDTAPAGFPDRRPHYE